MNGAGDSGDLVRQMRAQVKDLKETAERSEDPDERRRLSEKARKLEERTEQASGMASGDIYPLE